MQYDPELFWFSFAKLSFFSGEKYLYPFVLEYRFVTELVSIVSVLIDFPQKNKLPEAGVCTLQSQFLKRGHRRIRSSRLALTTLASVRTNSKLNQ